jgi:hypothetical protein
VTGSVHLHPRCGTDRHLAMKHAEVLTPAAGRLSFKVRLPIAHDLGSDTTLQGQAAAGSDFLFRKEMLPCEHVKWRKRKMSAVTHLISVIVSSRRIDGRCRLDALIVSHQACMRLLEIGERGCRPGGMVLKALPEPEPFVGALRKPSNESARGGVKGRDSGSTLGCEAKPALERGQFHRHAMPVRLVLIPTT